LSRNAPAVVIAPPLSTGLLGSLDRPVARLAHLRRVPAFAYRADQLMEGTTMRQLFDVVTTFAVGAAIIVGIGLMISFSSSALELMALR
jgi:hypothetical protein